MENVLIKFLSEGYPDLIWLGVIFIMVCLIIKYHPTTRDAARKLDLLISKFDSLSCKEHSQKIIYVEKELILTKYKTDNLPCNTHIQRINKLELDFSYARGETDSKKRDSMKKKSSPYKITDYGWKIINDNKLQSMVDNNWDKIRVLLKSQESQNPYDLDQFCMRRAFADTVPDHGIEFFTKKDVEKLKKLSYWTGDSLIEFTDILGIYIRDKYFEENNINADDIDDLDPDFQMKLEREDTNI